MARRPKIPRGSSDRTKFELVDKTSEFLVGDLNDASLTAAFHDFARAELGQALQINKAATGAMPDYETRVNGAPGRIEQANLRATIEFEFELASEMYQWIEAMLIGFSPIGLPNDLRVDHPGLYARSHVFFVDGILSDPLQPQPPHEKAVFVNLQPYARKIERGLSSQTPHGVYQTIAQMAATRYSNFARIKYTHHTPNDFGAIHEWADTTSMESPGRKGDKREEWLRRQPAIEITL